jgi:hypothetical protein
MTMQLTLMGASVCEREIVRRERDYHQHLLPSSLSLPLILDAAAAAADKS